MGYSKKIFCKECTFEKQFLLGVGMMYDSIDNILTKKDEKYKDILKLTKFLKRNKMNYKEYFSQELFVCHKCGNFERNLDITIKSEKFTHNYNYSCSNCNSNLEKINLSILEKNELKLTCPICSSNNMSCKNGDINWD